MAKLTSSYREQALHRHERLARRRALDEEAEYESEQERKRIERADREMDERRDEPRERLFDNEC